MKKILAMLLALIATVGVLVLPTLAANIDMDPWKVTDHPRYENYHQGHLRRFDSTLTEEEFLKAREDYRADYRKEYKSQLDQDVKDKLLTQKEADTLLEQFDLMADQCGLHMHRFDNSRYNRTGTVGYGRGHHGGWGHRGTGRGMGYGPGHCWR